MPRQYLPWHTFVVGKYYDCKTFTAQTSVGYLVKRCATQMIDLAERTFAAHGVNFTQWLVLMRLRTEAPMSVGELARGLGHDQGALTRVIDALDQAGLVERRRSRTDRRAIELRLTGAGRRSVEAQLPLVVDKLNELLDVFSNRELDTLIALLQRLLQRLGEFDPPARTGLRTAGVAAAG
ncbi:MAG: MarR family transcriptional regulator [Gammaproteobacteria bacterium]|nr:MarR family transcriptional regulator [Gammaproteobacteria bacterium]